VNAGFGAIVMSNASQTMPPTGGLRPFIGTNPLAIAFPVKAGAPFLLDMATSHVAAQDHFRRQQGESIPLGWAVDAEGRPTTDAHAALVGAVLPVGGAKGSGLSMAIDIMCGVLTGPVSARRCATCTTTGGTRRTSACVPLDRHPPLHAVRALQRTAAGHIALLKAEPKRRESRKFSMPANTSTGWRRRGARTASSSPTH